MKLQKEPDFLVNEFLEGPQEQLKRIVKVATRKVQPYDKKAAFFKEFTFGLLNAYRREKFLELQRIKEIKELKKIKPKIKGIVKKPVVKKKVKLDLPPPPKPKFESYHDIIKGSDGKVLAKAIYKGGVYALDEPKLNQNGVSIMKSVINHYGKKILRKKSLLGDKGFLSKIISKSADKLKMGYSDEVFNSIRYHLIRDLINLGRVDALVKDNKVNEIICDGAGRNVTIDYKGKDVGTNIVFDDDDEIDRVVLNLAEKAKKKVDVRHPFLNVVIDNLNIQANIKSGFSGAKFIIKKT